MSRLRNPVKAIRKHCLECVGGSREEVRTCTGTDCHLHPFRFGKNPYRSKPTEEERRAISERMKKARMNLPINRNRD